MASNAFWRNSRFLSILKETHTWVSEDDLISKSKGLAEGTGHGSDNHSVTIEFNSEYLLILKTGFPTKCLQFRQNYACQISVREYLREPECQQFLFHHIYIDEKII